MMGCDVKYIVKPEEGIVVGIYEFDIYRESELLHCNLNLPEFMSYIALYEMMYSNLGKTRIQIKAIAKCSPEDTFDEEYGKKLVKARIDFKYHKKLASVISSIKKDIMRADNCLFNGKLLHLRKMGAIQDDLEGYFKVER